MVENKIKTEKEILAWQKLKEKHKLSNSQIEQFQKYLDLLLAWNENMNLTAIVRPEQIINDHFMDSLELDALVDLSKLSMFADVGSGAGFPGIPLKIKYPHLKVVLIEVVGKKIAFLRNLVQELALEDVELYTLDWRTFLRKTEYPIDIFLTRASLPLDELYRMFKPSSPYKRQRLVYWASRLWVAQEPDKDYLVKEHEYQVANKKRKLAVFMLPEQPQL